MGGDAHARRGRKRGRRDRECEKEEGTGKQSLVTDNLEASVTTPSTIDPKPYNYSYDVWFYVPVHATLYLSPFTQLLTFPHRASQQQPSLL
jgi:hypothetical protein